MSDPYDAICRIKAWKVLLKELILLRRIEIFYINKSGTEVTIDIDRFTYYIDFKSVDNIIYLHRENVLKDIIED